MKNKANGKALVTVLAAVWAMAVFCGGAALVLSTMDRALEEGKGAADLVDPAPDTGTAPARVVSASWEVPEEEPEGAAALLEGYFAAREGALADLSETDLSGFFLPGSPEGVAETVKLNALVGARAMQRGDLSIESFSVCARAGETTQNPDGSVSARVFVDEGAVFAEAPDRAAVSGTAEHEMELVRTDSGWRLRSDSSGSPVDLWFDSRLGPEPGIAEAMALKEEYLDEVSSATEAFWGLDLSGEVPEGYRPYDGAAAASWALDAAGSCPRDGSGSGQAFASLALKAGGIGDDLDGEAVWAEGQTPSFSDPAAFGEYVSSNLSEGSGLAAVTGSGVYRTSPGDVVLEGQADAPSGTDVVTGTVSGRDGAPADVLVSSGDAGRRGWPLSALGLTEMGAVHVAGFFPAGEEVSNG